MTSLHLVVLVLLSIADALRYGGVSHTRLLAVHTESSPESPNAVGKRVVGNAALAAQVSVLSLLTVASPAAASTVEGYRAVQSPFAPARSLYSPPLLPQSALLNSLPEPNLLVGELQAYFESFIQLLNPTPEQERQIERNDSILWTNLRINAQRAAGMFLYNRGQLMPPGPDDPSSASEPKELRALRQKAANVTLRTLQIDALRLVNASRRSSVSDSLRCMRYALNSLNQAAYLSLPYRRLQDCSLRGSIEAAKAQNAPGERLPRLVGRCVVTLEFRRGGRQVKGRGAAQAGDNKALVRVVVDGIYHPVTAGNFIDLVKAGRYDDSEVREGTFELPGQALRHLLFSAKGVGEGTRSASPSKAKAKAGSGKESVVNGYVYSGRRRLPLEILRETADPSAPSKRFVAYGSARNSAVFTNSREQTQLDPSLGFSPTVNSFATYGALGMFHSREDASDGGLEFFVLPRDELGVGGVGERDASPAFRRLSSKYSLFAYCVDRNDVLSTLRAGDVLVSATAEPGVWELLR